MLNNKNNADAYFRSARNTIRGLFYFSLLFLIVGLTWLFTENDTRAFLFIIPGCGFIFFGSSYFTLSRMLKYHQELSEGKLDLAEATLISILKSPIAFLARKRKLYQLLAELYFQQGEFGKATAAIEYAMQCKQKRGEPDNVILNLDKGLYLLANDNKEDAEAILKNTAKNSLPPYYQAKWMYLELRCALTSKEKDDAKSLSEKQRETYKNLPGFFAAIGFALIEAIEKPASLDRIRDKLKIAVGEVATLRYFDDALA